MSKISPKVVDIDDNRIYTNDIIHSGKRTCNFGSEIKISGGNNSPDYIQNKDGRFPAQLFTNSTEEKFKYVKQI